MNSKLTLKLDKRAIDRAKLYARRKNQSLSSIVEKYFKFISDKSEKEEIKISPTVLELSGIIKIDNNYDIANEYGKHIVEKYK